MAANYAKSYFVSGFVSLVPYPLISTGGFIQACGGLISVVEF